MDRFDRKIKILNQELKLAKLRKQLYKKIVEYDYRDSYAIEIAEDSKPTDDIAKLRELTPDERVVVETMAKSIEELIGVIYNLKMGK